MLKDKNARRDGIALVVFILTAIAIAAVMDMVDDVKVQKKELRMAKTIHDEMNPVNHDHNHTWPVKEGHILFASEDIANDRFPLGYTGSLQLLVAKNQAMLATHKTACMCPSAYTVPFNMLTLEGNVTYFNVRVVQNIESREVVAKHYSLQNAAESRMGRFYTSVIFHHFDGVEEDTMVVTDERTSLCIQTFYDLESK